MQYIEKDKFIRTWWEMKKNKRSDSLLLDLGIAAGAMASLVLVGWLGFHFIGMSVRSSQETGAWSRAYDHLGEPLVVKFETNDLNYCSSLLYGMAERGFTVEIEGRMLKKGIDFNNACRWNQSPVVTFYKPNKSIPHG
jgi:hypothetical protein